MIDYLYNFFTDHFSNNNDFPVIISYIQSNSRVIVVYDCVNKIEKNEKGDLIISFKSNTQEKITKWKFNSSKILEEDDKTKNLEIWVLNQGNTGPLIYPVHGQTNKKLK